MSSFQPCSNECHTPEWCFSEGGCGGEASVRYPTEQFPTTADVTFDRHEEPDVVFPASYHDWERHDAGQ